MSPAPTEIYTLSLHDALPIYRECQAAPFAWRKSFVAFARRNRRANATKLFRRSEEHTSELQSHSDLVCRLLLEKKKSELRNERSRYTATHSCRVAAATDDAGY